MQCLGMFNQPGFVNGRGCTTTTRSKIKCIVTLAGVGVSTYTYFPSAFIWCGGWEIVRWREAGLTLKSLFQPSLNTLCFLDSWIGDQKHCEKILLCSEAGKNLLLHAWEDSDVPSTTFSYLKVYQTVLA